MFGGVEKTLKYTRALEDALEELRFADEGPQPVAPLTAAERRRRNKKRKQSKKSRRKNRGKK